MNRVTLTSILIFNLWIAMNIAAPGPKFIVLHSKRLSSTELVEMVARSKAECAVFCSTWTQCRVASYDVKRKDCRMFVYISSDATNENDSNSMLIMKPDCSGYTYDKNTDMCYKYNHINNLKFNWFQARFNCQLDCGDLVIVNTTARFHVLIKQAEVTGWIGLKDHQWVSGESFVDIPGVNAALNDYDQGFPSATEHCGVLAVASNGIYDSACHLHFRRSFICEIN